MRVVLDTNIWISGIVFGGIPLQILKFALQNEFNLLISAEIIGEVENVLYSQKFGFSQGDVNDAIQPLIDLAEFVVPQIKISSSSAAQPTIEF